MTTPRKSVVNPLSSVVTYPLFDSAKNTRDIGQPLPLPTSAEIAEAPTIKKTRGRYADSNRPIVCPV